MTDQAKIEDLRFDPGPDPGIDDLLSKAVVAPFAVNDRAMADVLIERGYRLGLTQPWGPSGLRLVIWRRVGHAWHQGSLIVTQADHPDDGHEWIHASIAFPEMMPTYEDLTALHRAVFGRRRWAYQVFPPENEHVNIHSYALHLWGRADGANVLPNFGSEGSI